jgi:hypothetical protein
MAMTWDDLRVSCLQKMFSLDGDTLVKDSTTTPYINMMPAAANEAMHILLTAGRQFKKCLAVKNDGEKGEPLGKWLAYDLKELAADFYALDVIYYTDGTEYRTFSDYRMEGERYLLLPADMAGSFRVWYDSYPPVMTVVTPGTQEIDLHPEEMTMVALYMAGQLYKDDDVSIAQIYMNEWATWLEELKQSARRAKGKNNGSGGGWTSVKGWT